MLTPTFMNITDVRSQISQLARDDDKENKKTIVLLKNGKPTMVLMGYDQWKKQQDTIEYKKKQRAVQAVKRIQQYAHKAQIAEKWLQKKGLDPAQVDDDQFLELLYEDDRKEKDNS